MKPIFKIGNMYLFIFYFFDLAQPCFSGRQRHSNLRMKQHARDMQKTDSWLVRNKIILTLAILKDSKGVGHNKTKRQQLMSTVCSFSLHKWQKSNKNWLKYWTDNRNSWYQWLQLIIMLTEFFYKTWCNISFRYSLKKKIVHPQICKSSC